MQRDEWRHTGDKKSGGGTNKQAEIQAGRMGETDRQTDRQTDRLTLGVLKSLDQKILGLKRYWDVVSLFICPG